MTVDAYHSSTGGLALSLPTEYHSTTKIIPKPVQLLRRSFEDPLTESKIETNLDW